MGKLFTDETGQEILQAMQKNNALLQAMAGESLTAMQSDLAGIQKLVRGGLAPQVFEPGDQLNIPWADGSTQYTAPNDIVHFGDVELTDGEVIPGMYLQWHFCSPFGVQFDAAEAFYYAETELAAGTYNIIVGTDWGTYCKKNEVYQFTLVKPVPAGGQLAGFTGMPDTAPGSWRVSSFESPSSTVAIETVTPAAGSNGTNLGTLTFAGDGKLNSMQRVAYGYNRWSQSAIRQYLNSSAAAGAWWKPQHNWDRPPAEFATKAGFMAGFSADFLATLKKIKVRTALNTVTDAALGTYEDTYDTFFLPSLEQEFITPQLAGVEGDTWEYWKRASGRTTKIPTGVTGAAPITYALNAQTSVQSVRLRSALLGYAYSPWCVYSSGSVYSSYSAAYGFRFAPACVIA